MTNPISEAVACILVGCFFPFIVIAVTGLMTVEAVLCVVEG